MRLGLLGPAGGDVGALGRTVELLSSGARVHRAIYLGHDALVVTLRGVTGSGIQRGVLGLQRTEGDAVQP